jgi:hypothetical protein
MLINTNLKNHFATFHCGEPCHEREIVEREKERREREKEMIVVSSVSLSYNKVPPLQVTCSCSLIADVTFS